ncbi:hypothetical protein Tco_0861042 [Tanacetum coccineum]|uniref:Uncharacterized protein n=1 Tax=Tanacetum coccineum TaxID=301880 RepID=A0ABQ5BGS7_9ASTR
MGCLPREAALFRGPDRVDTVPPNYWSMGTFRIRDNLGWYFPSKVMFYTMTIHFKVGPGVLDNGEWSRPTGFQFARENLQSRIEEENSITNIENAVFDLSIEVDINKKTENQAKMTKLSMEWKRLCKIKAKVQKCQSQSQYRRISSQTGAGTEEYYWMQS